MLILPLNVRFIVVQEVETFILRVKKFHILTKHDVTIRLITYAGIYINKIQRDATVCRCFFAAKLIYMFRVSIAPIIRSTSNCNYSFCYRS